MRCAIGPILVLAFATPLGLVENSWAHPGGLAADGCHREKATGTRHCHPERAGGASRATSAPRYDPPSVATFAAPISPQLVPQRALSVAEEEELVGLVRRLNDADRAAVLRIVRSLAATR